LDVTRAAVSAPLALPLLLLLHLVMMTIEGAPI